MNRKKMRGVHSIMIRKICKKATVWLLAGVISLSAVTVQAAEVDNGASYPITTNAIEGWPQGPDTYSETAVLMDADTGTILYNKGMDEKRYPASITKIMTALVALENADLSDVVTVSQNADMNSFAADEATCGIKAGDKITLSDLLYGLLLHSGNDNATAIAEYVGGSMDGFAEMMNKEAAKLMATGTHFVNSNGLHNDNHYTTAYDLYLIFNECIKHDDFVKIIMAKSHTAKVTGNDGTIRSITWEPTNFYATGDAKKPDNVTVIGGKTGTTQLAGNCLILLTKDKNDHPYISIVMKADTKPLLYKDMTAIVEAIPENN